MPSEETSGLSPDLDIDSERRELGEARLAWRERQRRSRHSMPVRKLGAHIRIVFSKAEMSRGGSPSLWVSPRLIDDLRTASGIDLATCEGFAVWTEWRDSVVDILVDPGAPDSNATIPLDGPYKGWVRLPLLNPRKRLAFSILPSPGSQNVTVPCAVAVVERDQRRVLRFRPRWAKIKGRYKFHDY